MNQSAIFSKTGKGVQEASGKSSHLSRADRGVLAAIDGKTTLADLQGKFEKLKGPKFEALIKQLDKDGFIREVSSAPSSVSPVRPAAPAAKPVPKPKADEGDDVLDFTQPLDKAEIQAKAAAAAAAKPAGADLAASKAKAEADLKAQAAAEAKAKTEAEAKAKAHAEAEARTRAEAEAKVKAAREAAIRLAAEAKAKADAETKAKEEAKAKAEAAEREKARVEAELGAKLEAERKAREEAERRAAELAEREKARVEAELRDRLETERKAREEAERRAAEAVEKARTELEQTSKRQAEELRKFLAAEMQAKLDEERKAREAEDRKRREAEDRRRAEEDEARAREDVKRRAREETDRKKREEEDRKRRADDERRREEEDARRAKEDAQRRERDEADRKRREEEERKHREKDEQRRKADEERRAKEDGERKSKSERKAKEEAERKARDDAEHRAKEESGAMARAAAASQRDSGAATLPPVPAVGDISGLLGDLESFGKREEEEQKAKEEAERKAKEEAERKAKEEAERKAKEEAERQAMVDAERRAKEESERKAKEEEERKEKEEAERKKKEESDRKRKAKEALAAKQAEERAARAARSRDDADIRDEGLDEEKVKRDRKLPKVPAAARPRKWGKPVAIALFVLLVGGIGVLNLMPVSTAEYETAASETFGEPVKIGSARMSVITGVELVFERVTIGDAVQIRLARGYPELGSLFGGRKAFSRIELEGVTISPSQAGDALFGKTAGDSFRMGRLLIKQLNLDGPLKLPPLDVDAIVAGNGSLQTVKLRGPDNLAIDLSPKGSDVAFEIKAGTFALPFVPALSLSEFAMKGSANRRGVTASEFDGRAYDGVIRGTARIVWGGTWAVDGEVKASGIRVGVFAPALMSEGRVEARASYTMSGAVPATLYESARMQGEFRIEKGVMGSFDITRALQTGGAQSAGRTAFNELTGQATYDRGAIQLRNIAATAGAMNAGASLDIDANGGLSGRIVADVRAANQNLRATLNFSGKVQDPVIRK